jgi:small basic protein
MTVAVSVPKVSGFGLVLNTAEALDTVVGAIVAGIALYFINNTFLYGYPVYVTILIGFILSTFLGNYFLANIIGLALMADGLYKLIKRP